MNRYPRYFDLEELLTSSTARQKSIENLPSFEIVEHLLELGFFLDSLREDWGSGINVNSGFRNDKLNAAVGGVSNSVHRTGYAADLYPSNGKFEDFKRFVVDWIKDKKYDQLILEGKGKSKWVHLGLYSPTGQQRRQCFAITK